MLEMFFLAGDLGQTSFISLMRPAVAVFRHFLKIGKGTIIANERRVIDLINDFEDILKAENINTFEGAKAALNRKRFRDEPGLWSRLSSSLPSQSDRYKLLYPLIRHCIKTFSPESDGLGEREEKLLFIRLAIKIIHDSIPDPESPLTPNNQLRIIETYLNLSRVIFAALIRYRAHEVHNGAWTAEEPFLKSVSALQMACFALSFAVSKSIEELIQKSSNLTKELAIRLEAYERSLRNEEGVRSVLAMWVMVLAWVARSCACCQNKSAKLKVCSGCRMVRYCSGECQKLDWANHRPFCKGVQDPRRSTTLDILYLYILFLSLMICCPYSFIPCHFPVTSPYPR